MVEVSDKSEEERITFKRKRLIKSIKSPLGMKRIRTERILPVKICEEKKKSLEERCYKCKKRLLSYLQFACRCGNKYCSIHRFYDKHECTFDYKQDNVKKMSRENAKITCDKISRV
ncbi:AN1-like Zinc finger protein [Spraguea lophii 42_110]|uniref:AN1-like Zinc finger protein n=1 Tax=Spraguea lophii (strain 42_110) TaxID=1358809 RepID=S7WC79_SPRLO|nr:AN1-like Zinc finger protein [Spraguea lophii 42_110]